MNTAWHPQSANGAIPSKLWTSSSSLNMYATTAIVLTRKMPRPMDFRTCPFAVVKVAKGLLLGRDSWTLVSNPMCFSWKRTWDAPVSTIRLCGLGGFACRASALDSSCLCPRFCFTGRFQKVSPPKSLPFCFFEELAAFSLVFCPDLGVFCDSSTAVLEDDWVTNGRFWDVLYFGTAVDDKKLFSLVVDSLDRKNC